MPEDPERGGKAMNLESSNTSYETYNHLGLAANEIAKIRELLQRVASRESYLKDFVGELANCLENLAKRVTTLESIVTDASESVFAQAQRDEEIKKSFEAEKAALEGQLQEREEILQTKDTHLKEMEANMAANALDLERRITEKESLLEVRDSVLKEVKSAMGSLNVLAEELVSLDEGRAGGIQETDGQENEKVSAEVELKAKAFEGLKQQMEAQVERLEAEVRTKDAMLAAKGMEVEMIKQRTGTKIRELEDLLKTKSQQRRSRFAAFLADVGTRR